MRLLCSLCTAMKCPLHSRYEVCATACTATCDNLDPPQDCEENCAEGCSCDEDYILSGDRCVPFSKCGCLYNDRYYQLGQVFYPSGQCQERCKCQQDGEVINTKRDNLKEYYFDTDQCKSAVIKLVCWLFTSKLFLFLA